MLVEISTDHDISSASDDFSVVPKQSTLNARKHPTRTINHENIKKLIKRSEMESNEDKDESTPKKETRKSSRPTKTRKLSFAPEKIIDYKPKFHQI